jgi:prepilin-type N-terminal cleavage/methylation domain-containing protein
VLSSPSCYSDAKPNLRILPPSRGFTLLELMVVLTLLLMFAAFVLPNACEIGQPPPQNIPLVRHNELPVI